MKTPTTSQINTQTVPPVSPCRGVIESPKSPNKNINCANKITSKGGIKINSLNGNKTMVRPWLDTAVKPKETKSRKVKSTPLVINKIFESCATLTDDVMWFSVFTGASQGNLPQGFMYKNENLTYKIGNKIKSVKVPMVPHEAYVICTEFFKVTIGLESSRDRQKNTEKAEAEEEERVVVNISSWKDLNSRKSHKEILLRQFVADITKSYNLKQKDEDELRTLINVGMLFGQINPLKDIILEPCENFCIITEINGLNYLGGGKFEIDPEEHPMNLAEYDKKSRKKEAPPNEMKKLTNVIWLKNLSDIYSTKKKTLTFDESIMSSPAMLSLMNQYSEVISVDKS